MSVTERDSVFERVRAHAFRSLSFQQRDTTNLYLVERLYQRGEAIGPEFQQIVSPRPSSVVFADDEPQANFGHACRYLLYDADSGRFQRAAPAQLPPWVSAKFDGLKPFHEPVRSVARPNLFHVRPAFRCPIVAPGVNRYAVLFSGVSGKAPLNDMEFLYRTLVDVYGYDPSHIYVLHYDGSLSSWSGMPTTWPGDGTAYRIQLNGPGTRSAFEAVIDDLKGRLRRDDHLLIHTNQCGGWDGVPGSACLYTFPNADRYYADDLAAKFGELPPIGQLCVMMAQCGSGGFRSPIIAHSTADATSVACAALEPNAAFTSVDGNWDTFARDWIAAQAGHDPFGAALAFGPDADGDGKIEAEEAFGYAEAVKRPYETPNFAESSEAGGDIALGQEYRVWSWWCDLLDEALEPYRAHLPAHEYNERLRLAQPELAKLTEELDRSSAELCHDMTIRVETLVASTFNK